MSESGSATGLVKLDRPMLEHAIEAVQKVVNDLNAQKEGFKSLETVDSNDKKIYKKQIIPDRKENKVTGTYEYGEKEEVIWDYRVNVPFYNTAVNEFNKQIGKLDGSVISHLDKVKLALEKIKGDVDEFENKKVGFTENNNLTNEDIRIVVTVDEDGIEHEIVYYTYTDKDGKEHNITIPEMVNSFGTNVGMSMAGVAEAGILSKDTDKNVDDAILNRILGNVNAFVSKAENVGAFKLASESSLLAFTEDVIFGDTGAEIKSWDDIDSKINEMLKDTLGDENKDNLVGALENEAGGLVSGGSLVSAGLLGAFTLTDFFGKIGEDEEEKEPEKEYKPSPDVNDKKGTDKSEFEMLEFKPDGDSELPPEGIIDEPEELEPEPTPEPVPEEKPKISDEDVAKIKKQIESNNDLETPEEMKKLEFTSEEFDNKARDEYYIEMAKNDKLTEERVRAVDTYGNMTDEQKISALESLGYTSVVAAGLVADQASGQTAYVLGLENQKLTEISNNLAMQQGFTGHDTRFDDPVGMDYFTSGQANVDLTPISQDVQAARANLTVAKNQYDSTVTSANEAINRANESKENYNRVLNSIRAKSGKDPKDWTEEEIKEYNKAAKEYNDAVDNANSAVKQVDKQKSNYDKQKEKYNVAYEKYREEAEKKLQQTIEKNDVPDENSPIVGETPTTPIDPIDATISGGDLNLGGEGSNGNNSQGQENDDVVVPADLTGVHTDED